MSGIIDRLKNEPALIAGVLGSAAMALQEAASWEDAVPLVVAAVIRQLVYPKPKVEQGEVNQATSSNDDDYIPGP